MFFSGWSLHFVGRGVVFAFCTHILRAHNFRAIFRTPIHIDHIVWPFAVIFLKVAVTPDSCHGHQDSRSSSIRSAFIGANGVMVI